jgi:hypothetical protein
MNFLIRAVPLLAACVLLLTASGCQGTPQDATAPSRPATGATQPVTQPTRLTGVLQGGMMAIGGETSGWVLKVDGEQRSVDLDVSAVRERAEPLQGKRVTVTGRTTDKQYVERGTVSVLVVERIDPAD